MISSRPPRPSPPRSACPPGHSARLPAWLAQADRRFRRPAPAETVTRLRVGTHKTADLREANRLAREAGRPQFRPDPPDDEHNYWADAIQRGDEFFYRVGETTVPISEHEYRMVIANPNTYYFSSALKLHYRIKHAREGKTIS